MNISVGEQIKTKHERTEVVLKLLILAVKSLQLYPANHATSEEAIEKLLRNLISYLGEYNAFSLNINKQDFSQEGRALGQNSPALQVLAQKLFRLRIESLVIVPGINKRELIEFLTVICMDPGDVDEAGGVKDLLWQKRVNTVLLAESRLTDLSRAAAPAQASAKPEIDQRYLRGLLAMGAGLPENKHAVFKGQLNAEPKTLGEFLQLLATGGSPSALADDLTENILPQLAVLIGRELPDEQTYLWRNLAEALTHIADPLAAKLGSRLFRAKKNRPDELAKTLIEQLTEVEISDFLRHIFAADGGRMDPVKFIAGLPLSPDRFALLLLALRESGFIDEDQAGAVEASLRQRRLHTVEAELPNQAQVEALTALVDGFNEEQLSGVLTELRETGADKLAPQVLHILAPCLIGEENLARFGRVTTAIQKIIGSTIEVDDFATVSTAIQIVIDEIGRRQNEPEALLVLRGILRDQYRPAQIELLLRKIEKNPSELFKPMVQYLSLLGEPVIIVLLDMLALADKPSRRRLICQLLVDLGRHSLKTLIAKINDNRWYFVRNVVFILGRIGNDEAVIYLRRAAHHEDARVRIEAVRALANLGPRALTYLIDLLEDRDVQVRLEAIRSMGRINNPQAVPHLMRILSARDLLSRTTDLKIEAINALGALRAQAALAYLQQLSGEDKSVFRQTNERLREAARQAIERMTKTGNE